MQFLLPACIVGLIIGIVGTTLYNPLAASLLGWSNAADDPGDSQRPAAGHRRPEPGRSGCARRPRGSESIVGAPQSYDDGLGLIGVTAYVFEPGGKFRERIDADGAITSRASGGWRTPP